MTWLSPRECTIVELLHDGTPMVRVGDDDPHPLPVHGITVPQPPSDLYVHILTRRIREGRIKLRCELADDGRQVARYSYLAWHDKTGDVWRDLARLLIDQGAAQAAGGDFPERDEYVQVERAARREGRGLWEG